jgi:HK97 family phage major capsid protein
MSGLKTPQQSQFEQWTNDVGQLLTKLGQSFAELKETQQRELAGQAGEITRLSNDFDKVQGQYAQRFHAIADHYYRGGAYKGPFESREQAAQFGWLVIASIGGPDQRQKALAELQRAGIVPTPGAEGGFLSPELLLSGIMRNVEQYGVFERAVPATPVDRHSGAVIKRTGGLTVYHPELEAATTASTPTFGKVDFALKRWATLTLIDRWFMADALVVSLGDFVATEIGHALAYAQDLYGFMGDGTSTYARVTGVLKRAGTNQLVVTGDTADDTFAEFCDASVKYLGAMMGTLPGWAHMEQPRWFMHLSVFFRYLSARDDNGMPIANILQADRPNPFMLMGYPVEITQVAPALTDTAVSTVFMAFGALQRGWLLARHVKGLEVRTSEHYKFAEGQIAIAGEAVQDIVETDNQAYVQGKTGTG